jgi:hypothetical protein
MFVQQPTSALNITTPATFGAQPTIPAGQTGQTGTQPSLFSGFGQQQCQPTQTLFGNPGQALQQQQQQQQQQLQQLQPGQPPASQSGGAPSLFGLSTWRPGVSTTPTQQLAAAQSSQPLFTKSTKFNDLPDNVKKTFEDIEYASYYCYDLVAIQLFLGRISRGESRSARILSNVKSEKKQPKVKI